VLLQNTAADDYHIRRRFVGVWHHGSAVLRVLRASAWGTQFRCEQRELPWRESDPIGGLRSPQDDPNEPSLALRSPQDYDRGRPPLAGEW